MRWLFAHGTKRRFLLTSLAVGFPIVVWMRTTGDGDPPPGVVWIFFTLVIVIPVRLLWVAITKHGKAHKRRA